MMSKQDLDREKKQYMSLVYNTHKPRFIKKLPRFYHNAVTSIKYMEKEGTDLKLTLGIIAKDDLSKTEKKLVTWAIKYKKEINYILKKTKILEECPFLNPYRIRVLVGRLLYGHLCVPNGTKETTQLFYYEEDLMEAYVEASTVFRTTYIAEHIPTYVRINTLSISREQCINAFCKEGWNLLECPKDYRAYMRLVPHLKEKQFVRDFHISELLVFPPGTSFYEHPGYLRGKFVLQDKGSCLASFLLNPKPGSRVLDMCAATGKTTNHIANIVNNEANVYAVDFHPHRFNKLHSFLQLTNSTCVEAMRSDVKQVCIDNLDYVLVDVSSTNSGISYKRGKGTATLKLRLRRSYYLNFKLLLYALQNFPTAKRVVYSACSIFPEEGEKVVDFALKVVGQSYELLNVKELLWNEWNSFGKVDTRCGIFPFASKCLRTNPFEDKCFGYFIAVFERNFEVPVPRYGFEKWEKVGSSIGEDESEDESEFHPKKKYKLVYGYPKVIKTNKPSKKRKFEEKQAALKTPIPKKTALLPTPQTSTSAPTLLPTPQTCTNTPALLPQPSKNIPKKTALLPTPSQTCTNSLLPQPSKNIPKKTALLPTPHAPTLLPSPQTCTNTLLPQPSKNIFKKTALLPTPSQTCTRANQM